MSNSSPPRVVRKHKPAKVYTLATFRKALPLLLDDFEQRCAYSLVHELTVHENQMHVDHHDPRKKRKSRYENLFPAYAPCNLAKHDTWPSKDLQRQGIRFLNPCKETDYNHQIFEDPHSNELVGVTDAARFHIDILDLNHPSLVRQRKRRAELSEFLNSPVISSYRSFEEDAMSSAIAQSLMESMRLEIPPIKPPPG